MKKNREKRKQLVKKTAVILVAANVLAMPLVTQVAPYTGKAFFYPTYPTEPTQPEPPIPTKPVVYPAKAGQTTVSGTISNASAYYLSVNGYMYSGMPISNAFTCYLTKPLQQGDVIKVYGTGSMSTQGETTTIIVGPGDSVPAPTISSVLSTQDYVTGTAKAGSTVTLTINGTQYTGVANTSGVYRIGIPTQAPGTVIYAKASLYGQTSPTVNTTVINGDTTPPNAPVLNSVMDTDRVVSGQAEANSTVRLYVGSTLVGTGTASNTGYFSITMNTAQPAGTTITATATDAAGNVSPKGSTVVKSSDTIPPNAPIIDPVKDNQTVITGTAEANSTVKLYNGSVLIGQTVASSSGWYAINMGTTYPAGTILRATATDAAGNTSTYGTQTVGSSVILTAPTIDPASSGDRVVSGTSTPNTAIILTVNGVKYQGATGPTGVYSVSVPALTAGTLIEAYAQSGTEVSPITRATVSDVAIKTPTINSITNQDTSVTGTADPNVTITISVPGGGTWTGYSDASGNYSVAISPQPAGTVIEATATKNGKVSDKARTTVIQTGIGTPTINTVTSNDTLVTGKTEPNASITLSIPQTDGSSKNWTGTADSNGNYTIIIPKQAGGTLIEVVAKKNGLTSEKASTTVVQTGIGTPTINTVTSNDTLVTGKAEPNASITLSIPQTDGSTKNWTGTADSNGDYAIVIPKQAGGTAIEVTASKNGMTSEKASTTVVQTALDTPTINTVTNKDTVVTGKAEPNAVIKVNIPQITGGTITWEGTSDASGNYSIIIPKQVAGTQIEVIAEKGGLASPKATTTVIQTELSAPTINELTDSSTTVSGTAEPNANLEIRIPHPSGGVMTWDGKADSNGNYSVAIPKQAAGTVVQVIASLNGLKSPAASQTVVDKTAPNTPVLFPIDDQATKAEGTTEAFAKVEISSNGMKIAEGMAGSDGKFSIAIPVQKEGNQIRAIATDASGNTSSPALVTVTGTAIQTPTINPVTEDSTSVTGTAAPNADVKLSVPQPGGGVLNYDGKADANGIYSINIAKQTAGTVLEVVTTLGSKTSAKATTTVQAGATDYYLTAPASYTIGEPTISGMFGKDISKVRLWVNGKVVAQATTDVHGNYTFSNVNKFVTKNSDVVNVVGVDNAYVERNRKTVTVVGNDIVDYSLTVNQNPYVIGTSTALTGTYGQGISKVRLFVNGSVVAQATTSSNGTYTFTNAAQFITSSADTVKVVGVDAQYIQRAEKAVTVQGSAVTYTLTADPYALNQTSLTGKYSSNIARVRLFVNGVVVTQAQTDGNGNYTFPNAGALIKAGDRVEVVGVDSRFVEQKRIQVTVLSSNMNYTLTVATNPYTVGSSTMISGTYGKDIARVRLFVNGAVVTQAQTDGNGNYTIPNAANFIKSSSDVVKVVGVDSSFVQRAESGVTLR